MLGSFGSLTVQQGTKNKFKSSGSINPLVESFKLKFCGAGNHTSLPHPATPGPAKEAQYSVISLVQVIPAQNSMLDKLMHGLREAQDLCQDPAPAHLQQSS